MTTPEKPGLESWKEVALYLGRSERTVKRWEAERGLPIRRFPGGGKSRIYALASEIDAWRSGVAEVAEESPGAADALPQAPVARRRIDPRIMLALSVVFAVAAGALAVPWLAHKATPPTREPAPLAAQRLYVAGMDDWAKRTPDGLNRSVLELTAATRIDPEYAEAWAGLAQAYDLIRQYTLMPDAQAYPLAKRAAERALDLDDGLADAHAALAFADAYGFSDAREARRHFARAVTLDPRSAVAHHWFATFLLAQGEVTGALAQIDAARRLDPASPSVAADRDDILFVAGRKVDAVRDLRAIESADPRFLSPHNYLAYFALLQGDGPAYLRETTIAARLTGDRARLAEAAAARRGLESGGERGLLEAILVSRRTDFHAGAASAFQVAQVEALLGEDEEAQNDLILARDRRDPDMTALLIDPAFSRLRGKTAPPPTSRS